MADLATIIASGSALGSFVVTSIYVWYTKKILQANQKMIEESKQARKELTMPNVIAYFDMPKVNIINFHIKNIGQEPAINTRVKLTQIIEFPKDEFLFKSFMVNETITTIAPQQELITFVGMLFELKNDSNDFPKVRVDIKFENYNNEVYKRAYILDLNMYKQAGQIGNNSIHELTKEVSKLKDEVRDFKKEVVKTVSFQR